MASSPHRVLLRLPDLTPRPGKKAARPAGQPSAPSTAPANTAKTSVTTAIHAAHTGEQRLKPPLPIVAAPIAVPKPATSKHRFFKSQPFLLLALIGITFGVLVGAIVTRDRSPPLAPPEPPPAWGSDGVNVPPPGVDGVTDRGPTQSPDAGTVPAPAPPRQTSNSATPSAPTTEAAGQVPGVARLKGRIEVETPVEANHDQPRSGLY
jgi:hypothetical protein